MADAKLQAAMEEIKTVLRRHDVAALVTLQSPGAIEYLYELSPTWSCITIEPAGAVRIRAQAATGPPSEKERLRVSAGMLMGFLDLARRNQEDIHKLLLCLSQHVEIEHISRADLRCPACEHSAQPDAFHSAVRNGVDHVGRRIADVGWRCPKCAHEFGFEIFHD